MPHSLSVGCFSLNKSTSYQSLCLCLWILSQQKEQEPPIHQEHGHFLKSQWRFSHDTCQMTGSQHEDAFLKLLPAPLGSLFDSALPGGSLTLLFVLVLGFYFILQPICPPPRHLQFSQSINGANCRHRDAPGASWSNRALAGVYTCG